ncbi:hypothetical protein [Sphingomonas morindae]|uniref:Uncharacterized protein n=1 Tax=Sphingomonas morindae TaxID=1541170 RepID=A0ABY4X5R9_9SPHN|nr:hypothetical protein [Sphingomonas morindae]USI72248.1 hypothetical protein LHA26_13225 [Sphingomonas morindae]
MTMTGALGRQLLVLASLGLAAATPAAAQLFWHSPDFRGAPVTGDEPQVVIPLPGATDAEKRANIVWTLRAGLNVAALQCQFAPSLMTVNNYNGMLSHHAKELTEDYKLLGGYFKRMAPKGTSAAAIGAAFDQYTTRTYNSFSTLNAQLGFCQTASNIGEQAILTPKKKLADVARLRLREFRNSLTPVGDLILQQGQPQLQAAAVPDFPPDCYDKKGQLKKKCLKG